MQKKKLGGGGGGAGRSGRLVRMVMNEELKLFWKCIKNVRGDQGGCERRIEVLVKM